MRAWRLLLAAAGIALGLFGVSQLITQVPVGSLAVLGVWLVAALAIHDGLLAPVVIGTGWLLRRVLPDRGRRYLQAALLTGAVVTVVATPLLLRAGSQPPAKAMLLRDYGDSLTVLLGVVGGCVLVGYAVRVTRDRAARSSPDHVG